MDTWSVSSVLVLFPIHRRELTWHVLAQLRQVDFAQRVTIRCVMWYSVVVSRVTFWQVALHEKYKYNITHSWKYGTLVLILLDCFHGRWLQAHRQASELQSGWNITTCWAWTIMFCIWTIRPRRRARSCSLIPVSVTEWSMRTAAHDTHSRMHASQSLNTLCYKNFIIWEKTLR